MPPRIPPNIIPLLEKIRTTLGIPGLPLEFWHIDHGPTILEGFLQLSDLLIRSELPEDELPRGYLFIMYLFHWENDCQLDGWNAFGNIESEDLEKICGLYASVGLTAQANVLRHQMLAYEADPEDYDALMRSRDENSHELSGDFDRIQYLTEYLCGHADALLYEHF